MKDPRWIVNLPAWSRSSRSLVLLSCGARPVAVRVSFRTIPERGGVGRTSGGVRIDHRRRTRIGCDAIGTSFDRPVSPA
jgi:hypothetical protein